MSTKAADDHARWQGRNPEKDSLRSEVWTALTEHHVNRGPVWSHIPDFIGAEAAADRLAELPFWKTAQVVKCNPDPPQIPVRLRALQEGKLLYTPIPELAQVYPFVLLDPEDLKRRGIPFEAVAPIEGAVEYGIKVHFEEMKPLDIVVVGCVAVTRAGGRTGKGGGFADLELGIFREVGIVTPATPIVTTVHPLQVVDDARLVMQPHDTPLDWIITPDEVIETHTAYDEPQGVDWEHIQPDQWASIPFLRQLKERYAQSDKEG
jgi:5-formyltetrahydrofolate cyclo-ligase